jgi:hypothetical protein
MACILGSYGAEIRIEWPLGHTVYHCLNTLRSLRIRGDQLVVFQEKQGNVEEGVLLLVDRKGQVRELCPLTGLTGLAWGPRADEIWVSTYHRGESRILALDLAGKSRVLLHHAGRLEIQDVDGQGRVLAALHTYQRHTFAHLEGESSDRDLGWLDAQATMGMTSDAKTVLLANLGEWSITEGALYLRPLAGGPAQRLGLNGTSQPSLSSNGQWVGTFTHEPEFGVVVAATGRGSVRNIPLQGMKDGDISAHVYGDGRQAFIWGSLNRGPVAGFFLDLESHALRKITRDGLSPFLFESPCSGDEQWLALIDGNKIENGTNPIVIIHPDGTGERIYPWLKPGEAISRWGPDSASLIVWDRNRLPALVERLDLATGRRTPMAQITPPDPAGVPGIQGVFLSPSGTRYAYNFVRKLSQLYTIEGLK